ALRARRAGARGAGRSGRRTLTLRPWPRPSGGGGQPFALCQLFGNCHYDPGWPPHVTELVLVLVLRHLTDELPTVCLQAPERVGDACDREHDAPQAQGVRGRGRRRERLEF